MNKTYKRVTLVYDFDEELTDQEAVAKFIEAIENEVLNFQVQTLPGLGAVRWIEM